MARKLWINLVESFSLHKTMDEPPKHFTASLGFGHVLPMDDLFMHKEGGLPLQSFTLHDPKNAITELRLPAPENYTMKEASCGLTVETGDFAVHKFSIGNDAIKGTYQLAAESADFFIQPVRRPTRPTWFGIQNPWTKSLKTKKSWPASEPKSMPRLSPPQENGTNRRALDTNWNLFPKPILRR